MDLAADLERFLADEPVSVVKENKSQKLARWVRHHRVAAQSIVAAIAVIAIMAIASAASLVRTSQFAQQAHDKSLHTSAIFAARMLAQEIEGRWSVLTAVGSDPELLRIVRTLNAHPNYEEPDEERLQAIREANAWLARYRSQFSSAFPSASWTLLDQRGIQCGRVAEDSANLLNRSFAHRSYFHGGLLELEPDEAVDVKPLETPAVSPPYRSTAFPVPTVTLSVPIRVDGAVAGVLTMSLTAGDFQALRMGQSTDQQVILADLRPDSSRNKGVVLHHGAIDSSGRTVGEPFIYLKRDRTVEWSAKGALPLTSPRVYRREDITPEVNVGPEQLSVALAPVLVRWNSSEYASCGWLVLMTQAAH
jgi:type II secretory pathway pseudopilin PulG